MEMVVTDLRFLLDGILERRGKKKKTEKGKLEKNREKEEKEKKGT